MGDCWATHEGMTAGEHDGSEGFKDWGDEQRMNYGEYQHSRRASQIGHVGFMGTSRPNSDSQSRSSPPPEAITTSSLTSGPALQLGSPREVDDPHGREEVSFNGIGRLHVKDLSAPPALSINTDADFFRTATSSPQSPRSRFQRFSLRRSLLARGVRQQPGSGSGSIELEPAEASSSGERPVHGSGGNLPGNKSEATVRVSPIVEQMKGSDRGTPSSKAQKSSPFPPYASWATEKTGHTGILRRVIDIKERIRETILGIRGLQPSQDGRHVQLDLGRTKHLMDNRGGHEYIDNTIRSSKYTLWNFLPRQLFAQFSKLANLYFLSVSILQLIPGLSTTGTYTTIVPLLFFVSISMAKEGYDDFRRYRLDKADNRKTTFLLKRHAGWSSEERNDSRVTIDELHHWEETEWQNVGVGDVIRIKRDEAVPADLLLLHVEGTENIAYIETMALDGETNLKMKSPSPPLGKACSTVEDLAGCRANAVVEDPNLDLYSFEGKVIVGNETVPLTNNEIVYRGSVLRNTSEIMGLVIYTGEECKIRMNATKNPRVKAPALQAVVNKVVIMIVTFVVVLAIFNTAAYQVWRHQTEKRSWYIAKAHVAFGPILISFIILFNTMVPLSLYVSLEIVKLFQILFMNDIDMYDEETDTPMEARTSTINEELGQINYIFSDKTGTLTNNSMRFRKMSVAGTAWLHDSDLQEDAIKKAARRTSLRKKVSKGKAPARKRTSHSKATTPTDDAAFSQTSGQSSAVRHGSFYSQWKCMTGPYSSEKVPNSTELLGYVQARPHTLFARKVRSFLLCIAICHTCFPETNAAGEISYQAASPDEQALVRAAQELGYIVVDRQNGVITIKTFPHGQENGPCSDAYQVLDVIEFSSARKRMSVIVRQPDGRICLFCKGADSTLIHLLRLSGIAIAKASKIEKMVSIRRSSEAQQALRQTSEAYSRRSSLAIRSPTLPRSSLGGYGPPSLTVNRLQPIQDEFDPWLTDRGTEIAMFPLSTEYDFHGASFSAQTRRSSSVGFDVRHSFQGEMDEMAQEVLTSDDAAVFERCFQHINDFANEGLRTLLLGYRYMEEDEYKSWKKVYLDASTSLVNRQEMVEKAGALVEQNLELVGATAIEDKLQEGVPETIDKLRRAGIKLWVLTGDKRETAINIGHSCRLIKDYSSITILDHQNGDVSESMIAATAALSNGAVAHSVVVVDGQTLAHINACEMLHSLFLSLAILVDSVICCRASPSQKALLVHSIRSKVKDAVTLAIGDGANDIAMIQEAHVGIGITGKEGLQAARTSDYSIARFRFLAKLLLVHGRWNYIRICKYTLGTFWKEMFFYITQALYQHYTGYTGTSLYESWSLSMFNTLFTSLPVIFLGIFEQDLRATTLMAVPELYASLGPANAGFSIPLYLSWAALAVSQSAIVFFVMLGLFGQASVTSDNALYAMGTLTFTACIIVIASKLQFWELHNRTFTCVIAMLLSVGGWFMWTLILSATYKNNTIYDVRDGFLQRFGRSALWWLTLALCVVMCWVLEISVKSVKTTFFPSDADCFRELEKDKVMQQRFAQAAGGNGDFVQPGLQVTRTAEDEQEREIEIQKILDRPRQMSGATGADEQEVPMSATVRKR